jgi:hypothetical protein
MIIRRAIKFQPGDQVRTVESQHIGIIKHIGTFMDITPGYIISWGEEGSIGICTWWDHELELVTPSNNRSAIRFLRRD